METISPAGSRRYYSWWWDSHICPKNSKWLQENLAGMDIKVKSMIKLIEEDADSFARRAEMYYEKRPELIKLVEEFYHAYRALAKRYDHATMVLRQAHQTMEEAFPNQIPILVADDSSLGPSSLETERHLPEMPYPISTSFNLPEDSQKDDMELSSKSDAVKRNRVCFEDDDVGTRRKGLKQLSEMFIIEDADHPIHTEGGVRKGLHAQQEGRKDDSKYIVHEGSREEKKMEIVDKQDSATTIRRLEEEVSRLLTTNQDLKTRVFLESELVGRAKSEVASLHQTLSDLQDEQEAARFQYQQCLEKLSNVESEQNEVGMLKDEIEMGVMKLTNAEERCHLLDQANQSLQLELDTLMQKMKMQQQELSSKHMELEILSICVQDEHQHRIQVEEALQSLQNSCSQAQKENTSWNLQGTQILKDKGFAKQEPEDEAWKVKENSVVEVQKLSSRLLIKNLQDEVSSLKKMKTMLEDEVRLCIHQKNVLQEDLDCLKEGKDDLNRRYQAIMEQVESVGLNENCLKLSVKDIQDENLKLKEILQITNEEKVALLEKLERMVELSEEKMLLEKSLSYKETELEALKGTIDALKESYHSMYDDNLELKEILRRNSDDKVVLLEKLENMENLLEKNRLLENSLSDTSAQLQMLKADIKELEDSYKSLKDENMELKDNIQKVKDKNIDLLEKVRSMDNLLENNMLLENSLSDANAELQGLRANLKTLDNSFHSFQKENITLKKICQKNEDERLLLVQKLESMEKLSEENVLLENSLSDACVKLQRLNAQLKSLEGSIQSLQEEKSNLASEKHALVSKVESITLNMEKILEKNVHLEDSLSNMNVEVERVRENSNYLKKCCESLQDEKNRLLADMHDEISQVESNSRKMEELSDRNAHLEASLSYLNLELNTLGEKSKILRECYQSLHDENSRFLAGRNHQISQVETVLLDWLDLDRNYKELRSKYLGLEMDRDSNLHRIYELRVLLNVERQEHANSVQSSKTKCANLEKQLQDLQEKVQRMKKAFKEEQKKVLGAHIKMVVLLGFMYHFKERTSTLFIKSQTNIDAYKQAIETTMELKKENHWQRGKVESLLLQCDKLNMVLCQVLKLLDISVDDVCLDTIQEHKLLPRIIEKINILQQCSMDVEDENQLLIFEKSINITVLEQMRQEACDLKRENNAFVSGSGQRKAELLAVQSENYALLEKTKQLILVEQATVRRMEVQKVEMDRLHGQFSNLTMACMIFQDENYKLLERNKSLARVVCDVEKKNHILQQENDDILTEAIGHSNLSVIFESIVAEKIGELELLKDDFNFLCGYNIRLEKNIKEMVEKMETVERENIHQKESLGKLEEYKSHSMIELNIVRHLNDQLRCETEIGKNILSHKDVTMLEVGQKLETMQSKTVELCKENEEYRTLAKNLKAEIVKKSNDVECWERENSDLRREIEEWIVKEEHFQTELSKKINEIQLLQTKSANLLKEVEEYTFQKEQLQSSLFEKTNEVELWEREFVVLFEDLQVSIMRALIYKEKAFELIVTCEYLHYIAICDKQMYSDEMTVLNSDIKELKKEISVLEGVNLGLKSETAAYLPLILLLKEKVSSLEYHALSQTETVAVSNQQEQNVSVETVCRSRVINRDPSDIGGAKAAAGIWEPLVKVEAEKDAPAEMVSQSQISSQYLGKSHGPDAGTGILELCELQDASVDAIESCDAGVAIGILESPDFQAKVQGAEKEISKEMTTQSEIRNQGPSCDAAGVTVVLELQKLLARIQAVEKAVMEARALSMLKSSKAEAQLEVANEKIEDLKLKQLSVPEHSKTSKNAIFLLEDGGETTEDLDMQRHDEETPQKSEGVTEATEDQKLQQLPVPGHAETRKDVNFRSKDAKEPSEDHNQERDSVEVPQSRCRLMVKDFQPNNNLDSLSCGNNSFEIDLRHADKTEVQMLKLWETAEHCKFESVETLPMSLENADVKECEGRGLGEQKSENASYDSQAEKVILNQTEKSTIAMKLNQEICVRILERLAGDSRKLINLQTFEQELKMKVDKLGMSSSTAGFQSNKMKEQLLEVKKATLQLIDVNQRLLKNAEDGVAFENMDEDSIGEMWCVHEQRILEGGQMLSEKITSLELELQRIQSILLKFENQHGSHRKLVDEGTNVLLRDYIDGNRRKVRKKAHCCVCIRPKTIDDFP